MGCQVFLCYNFSSMRRGIILAIVVISTVVINGQEKSSKSTSNANTSCNVDNPAPPSTQVVGAVNQPNSNQENNRAENHAQSYLSHLISPEVLATIGLIGVGIWGIRVALRTLDHMRESSEIQARAYVIVERGIIANVANPQTRYGEETATVARLLAPHAGPTVQITIKNTGQTPAYDLVHWGSISIREYPLLSGLPTMPRPAVLFRSTLGSSVVEVKTIRLPNPLSAEQIRGLRESRMAIYSHGEIHYRDAFNRQRVTLYRVMYCAVTGIEIGVSTDLTLCEEGNEAN